MAMNNVHGLQSANEVKQHALSSNLGAPLLLVTYSDADGMYYGKNSVSRVQVKVIATGIRNSGFSNIEIWERKRDKNENIYYAYASDLMDIVFGTKTAKAQNGSGLSKQELTRRGLELEQLASAVHQMKVGKSYAPWVFASLAEAFVTCWREIGGDNTLADLMESWLSEEDTAEVEIEDEEEQEEAEV